MRYESRVEEEKFMLSQSDGRQEGELGMKMGGGCQYDT